MKTLNEKLGMLQQKMRQSDAEIRILIVGLGSVGLYLLDYLVSLADPRLHIIVAGRHLEKMQSDVNIVKTAATIRGQYRCRIEIDATCDLVDIAAIARTIERWNPDFIVNSSRVCSGLKYGTISWHNLRAYGIWTPLSIRYARNIMEAYAQAGSSAIAVNTSYSDAVIPWLKSAEKAWFEDEGVHFPLSIRHNGKELNFDRAELLKACMIAMPTDQKRNMMNASSNFNIIHSILSAIDHHTAVKFHTPGVGGEIGGYPFIVDATGSVCGHIDESVFSLDEMRQANRQSIYLDGVRNVEVGVLEYTPELIRKVKKSFGVDLPKKVAFDEIDAFGNEFLIKQIIEPNLQN